MEKSETVVRIIGIRSTAVRNADTVRSTRVFEVK